MTTRHSQDMITMHLHRVNHSLHWAIVAVHFVTFVVTSYQSFLHLCWNHIFVFEHVGLWVHQYSSTQMIQSLKSIAFMWHHYQSLEETKISSYFHNVFLCIYHYIHICRSWHQSQCIHHHSDTVKMYTQLMAL